ncbi:MAG: hypothetical protein ACD_75C00595G0003 [uncultured bacterium]|nr:MAG: hypothetical protein ACD_75C00595G0003 [uncultured bacterium]
MDPISWQTCFPSLSSTSAGHLDGLVSAGWVDQKDASNQLEDLALRLQQWHATNTRFQLFIVLHHGNFPSVDYLAEVYRNKDYKTIAVYFFNEPPGATFDESATACGSFKAFHTFFQGLPPINVYVQAHAKWSFLGLFIKASNSRIRVCQEVYDWMTFFIDPALSPSKLSEFTEPETVPTLLEIENVIRNDLDGFLYKDGGKHMEHLLHSSRSPSFQYMPCPPLHWHKRPQVPMPPEDGWKMVYAGQLKNASASRSFFGDLQLHDVIGDLSAQEIHCTAYSGYCPTQQSFYEGYRDYLTLEANNDYFHLKRHLPIKELIDRIHNRFHFGLLIYYFDHSLAVGIKHLESALPSKLFTYISAGLPVIISEELRYAASLVRQFGIGIVVNRDQIKNLSSLLSHICLKDMVSNVKKAQNQFHTERFFDGITALLERR